MKKLVFLLVLPIFLFSNTPIAKKQLILKANKGDVQAITLLGKYYNFPETKEGLLLFKKWYKLMLNKKNKKDILEFTRIYALYNAMFINGEYKTIKLLNLVATSKDSNTLFELLKFLADIKKDNWAYNLKIEDNFYTKLRDKFIDNNLENLEKLYDYYAKEKIFEKRRQLIYLAEKKYPKAYFLKFKTLESLYRKDTSKAENKKKREEILDSIIKTKNINKILITTKKILSKNYYPHIDALKLLEEAIKLDKKNPEIYLLYASIYKRGDNKKTVKINNKKQRYYLKELSKLNNYEGSLKLLDDFFSIQHPTKEDYEEYFKVKKLLLSTSNGKLALANKYYANNKKYEANTILDSLAKKANEQAIIILASRNSYKTFQLSDPEEYQLATKWSNHILNSNNLYLIRKFKQYLLTYKNKYNENLSKIYQLEFANNNSIAFYNSFISNGSRSKEALKELEKAAQIGDNTSLHKLASIYVKNYNKKAIDIYEKLAKENDAKALYTLGNFYESGFLDIKKDIKKSIEYYKKSYEATKYKLAANALANIYKNTEENINPDLEKSKIWEKRAEEK